MKRAQPLHVRRAGPSHARQALLVHGYPQSSWMWQAAQQELAAADIHSVAVDLAGFGDSPTQPPGTWERQVEALERTHAELGLDRVALVMHDWGSLIGLRWACEHPSSVSALVISSGGFFADGKWHGLARSLRTPGEGEAVIEGFTRDGFDALMGEAAPGISAEAIAHYWKAFASEESRRGHLELYRSGDMEKLARYDGQLAELGVPTLLLWGEDDQFAPLAGARRFQREIPGAQLIALPGVGHFIWDEQPERTSQELAGFLLKQS
ncbi:MAG: alpha/beta fold hydrolase [Solirubrobacteraceae bacterium]